MKNTWNGKIQAEKYEIVDTCKKNIEILESEDVQAQQC